MTPGAPGLAEWAGSGMTDREWLLDDQRSVAFAVTRMLGSVSDSVARAVRRARPGQPAPTGWP